MATECSGLLLFQVLLSKRQFLTLSVIGDNPLSVGVFQA